MICRRLKPVIIAKPWPALLSARVSNERGDFNPEFDHLVLLVSLDRLWLADVGFGESFREPLLLSDGGEQIEGGNAYRLAHFEAYHVRAIARLQGRPAVRGQ